MMISKSSVPEERRSWRRALIRALKPGFSISLLSITIYLVLPPRPPNQDLWDRLGMVVEDDYAPFAPVASAFCNLLGRGAAASKPGVAIVKVEGPADSANITATMRLLQIAARVPGDEGPDALILPAENVATVEQAESALNRALYAAEWRRLEQMEINLGVAESGRPTDIHSFTIPLIRLLPSR